MQKVFDLCKKYREVIAYTFFGLCATAVNIIAYYLLDLIGCNTFFATLLAWFISVLFAFFTNRTFVFENSAKSRRGALIESLEFFFGRIMTGILDIIVMLIFVDILLFPGMLIKVLSNIIVIILNYIISKFWVFRKKKKKNESKAPEEQDTNE